MVLLVNTNDEGGTMLKEEAVIYNDGYVKENGQWFISKRASNFVIMDSREMLRN